MGFRDIHVFNLAMLAKQAWRLVHHTQSLFYKVYKARCFPNYSFLDADIGHNPSYVWRSLLMASDILVEGTKWRVGDDRKIDVTSHKWLPHALVFCGPLPSSLYVKDLLDKDTRCWDRGKYRHCLPLQPSRRSWLYPCTT